MKTPRIATVIALLALAACDNQEEVQPVTDDLCVLDPATISQPAVVLHAHSADPACGDIAQAFVDDGQVAVEKGLVLGAPLQLTSFTSHDGTPDGVRCAYDLGAVAVPTLRLVAGGSCAMTLDLKLRVLQP